MRRRPLSLDDVVLGKSGVTVGDWLGRSDPSDHEGPNQARVKSKPQRARLARPHNTEQNNTSSDEEEEEEEVDEDAEEKGLDLNTGKEMDDNDGDDNGMSLSDSLSDYSLEDYFNPVTTTTTTTASLVESARRSPPPPSPSPPPLCSTSSPLPSA